MKSTMEKVVKPMRIAFALSVLLAVAPCTAGLPAQMPAAGPQGAAPAAPVLQTHQLSLDVFWVSGGVGNVGFILGNKGVTLVDTTISEVGGRALLAEVAKVTPKPVTTVILTHGDGDHVGGLGAFPAHITVIAQENNKKRMEDGVAAGRVHIPADHLPNRGIATKEMVTANGVKMQLLHWAPAHTDGDLVIYLPEQKIVFTGDIFAMNQPRALIHREQGGTSEGWVTTAKGILALDADKFVVGHGDVQTKASLQERLDLVVAEREQIRKLVGDGKSLAEVEAAVSDPPPGIGPQRFTPFAEVVYQELTENK